jgi:hypothetical protein
VLAFEPVPQTHTFGAQEIGHGGPIEWTSTDDGAAMDYLSTDPDYPQPPTVDFPLAELATESAEFTA